MEKANIFGMLQSGRFSLILWQLTLRMLFTGY